MSLNANQMLTSKGGMSQVGHRIKPKLLTTFSVLCQHHHVLASDASYAENNNPAAVTSLSKGGRWHALKSRKKPEDKWLEEERRKRATTKNIFFWSSTFFCHKSCFDKMCFPNSPKKHLFPHCLCNALRGKNQKPCLCFNLCVFV